MGQSMFSKAAHFNLKLGPAMFKFAIDFPDLPAVRPEHNDELRWHLIKFLPKSREKKKKPPPPWLQANSIPILPLHWFHRESIFICRNGKKSNHFSKISGGFTKTPRVGTYLSLCVYTYIHANVVYIFSVICNLILFLWIILLFWFWWEREMIKKCDFFSVCFLGKELCDYLKSFNRNWVKLLWRKGIFLPPLTINLSVAIFLFDAILANYNFFLI